MRTGRDRGRARPCQGHYSARGAGNAGPGEGGELARGERAHRSAGGAGNSLPSLPAREPCPRSKLPAHFYKDAPAPTKGSM
jgi:hypothetical protein